MASSGEALILAHPLLRLGDLAAWKSLPLKVPKVYHVPSKFARATRRCFVNMGVGL